MEEATQPQSSGISDRDYVLFLAAGTEGESLARRVTFLLPTDIGSHLGATQPRGQLNPTWSASAVLRDKSQWCWEGDIEPRKLVVATDLPNVSSDGNASSQELNEFLPSPTLWYGDELLKSAIQKAVRRRKSWTAVRLGYQLMRQSMAKFLRRVPVILMEDSICHPKFLFLIWLMVAHSKGWELTRGQLVDTLQILYEIADCEYHDVLPEISEVESHPNPLFKAYKDGLAADKFGRLAAMMVRSTYGGRGWDQVFLKAFVECWHERFMRYPKEWEEAVEGCYGKYSGNEVRSYFYHVDEQGGSDISSLKDKDKLPEAIDFHCYPKIVDTLLSIESLADLSREEVEKAIWYHRSGVYEKVFLCDREHSDRPMLGRKDLVDSKVMQGQERTRGAWDRVKNYLEELVAGMYYWKGRNSPPQPIGSPSSMGQLGLQEKGKGSKKRKREEKEKEEKKQAEALKHFLEDGQKMKKPKEVPTQRDENVGEEKEVVEVRSPRREKKQKTTRPISFYFVNKPAPDQPQLPQPQTQPQPPQQQKKEGETEHIHDVVIID